MLILVICIFINFLYTLCITLNSNYLLGADKKKKILAMEVPPNETPDLVVSLFDKGTFKIFIY